MTSNTDLTTNTDSVEQSQMPLIDHLVELRQRLIYAAAGIAIAFVVCFFYSSQIYDILLWPYKFATESAGLKDVRIIFTAPHELFFVYLKVSFFGAVFVAFPLIATQLYRFVAPGL